jgi:DNA-binding MarR family transcriptional regulator
MSIETETTQAWQNLHIVSRTLLERVEAAFKQADLPSLSWYDVLWEVEKAGAEGIRPNALIPQLLLPQYQTSRLLDRLVNAGLIDRVVCDEDRRGCRAVITEEGKDMRARMWEIYKTCLDDLMQKKLGNDDRVTLAQLLQKLK